MLKDKSVLRRVMGVVVGAVLVGVVVVAAVLYRKDTPDPMVVPPVVFTDPPSVTLQEDDPGWDCATMGNRMCGVPSLDVNGDGHLSDIELGA